MQDVGAVYVDASALNQIADVLREMPTESEVVVARVLWRVRDNARSEIVRQVPRTYAIKREMVRSSITKRRRRFVRLGATAEDTVSIEVIGKPINLVRFPHSPKAPPYGNARLKVLSQVKITKSSGMQTIGGVWRERFSARDPWKSPPRIKKPSLEKKNVFLMPTTKSPTDDKIPCFFARRTGKPSAKDAKEEGIEPLSSISIPQMVLNPKVAKPLTNYIEQQIQKRITVELTNMVVSMSSKVGK